jgi:hypothetical protein
VKSRVAYSGIGRIAYPRELGCSDESPHTVRQEAFFALCLICLDIFLWHTLKQMLACFGTKIIGLVLIQNLEWRILRINLHFTHRINLEYLTRRIKSLHIETAYALLPLLDAGAPHEGQNRESLFI